MPAGAVDRIIGGGADLAQIRDRNPDRFKASLFHGVNQGLRHRRIAPGRFVGRSVVIGFQRIAQVPAGSHGRDDLTLIQLLETRGR